MLMQNLQYIIYYVTMHKMILTLLRRLWAWPRGGRGGACCWWLRATTARASINCKMHISARSLIYLIDQM